MAKKGCFTGNGSLVTWTPDNNTGEEAAAATLFGEASQEGSDSLDMRVRTLPQPRVQDVAGKFQRRCPTEPIEVGPFTTRLYFEPDMNISAMVGRRGTITRLHPTPDGMASGATWSGPGYIERASVPEERSGRYSMADVTFQFEGQDPDGNNSLTHTPAAAAQ